MAEVKKRGLDMTSELIPIKRSRQVAEIMVILILSVIVYRLAARYDILETILLLTRKYEAWELDEIITVMLFLFFILALHSFAQWHRLQRSENSLLKINKNLEKTLHEINQLRGILPICAACKKIRDDKGFWYQVDIYIRDHSKVEFSHSICPECERKLYPGLFKK